MASATESWELVSKGAGVNLGPVTARRGRDEALSAAVPPLGVPAPPTHQSSQAARGSGFGTRSVDGSGTPATPTRYLRARRRSTRVTRRHCFPPPKLSAELARGSDVVRARRAPVTSGANGGGVAGTLAGCGSAEKALCASTPAAQGGGSGGPGPGGRAGDGRRSRASSHPGGRVSAGSASTPGERL